MNQLLPIIEQLADTRDHQARREWLLRCPYGVMSKYRDTIRNRLMIFGFQAGVAYVDAIGAAMQSVRDCNGNMPVHARETLLAHAENMKIEAARGQAADDQATSDPGVTDL